MIDAGALGASLAAVPGDRIVVDRKQLEAIQRELALGNAARRALAIQRPKAERRSRK